MLAELREEQSEIVVGREVLGLDAEHAIEGGPRLLKRAQLLEGHGQMVVPFDMLGIALQELFESFECLSMFVLAVGTKPQLEVILPTLHTGSKTRG